MVIKHVLRLDQERAGFEVVEPDDHIVELRRHGLVEAVFSPAVSIHRLREMADKIMWIELTTGARGGEYAQKA